MDAPERTGEPPQDWEQQERKSSNRPSWGPSPLFGLTSVPERRTMKIGVATKQGIVGTHSRALRQPLGSRDSFRAFKIGQNEPPPSFLPTSRNPQESDFECDWSPCRPTIGIATKTRGWAVRGLTTNSFVPCESFSALKLPGDLNHFSSPLRRPSK